jgi:uncharacterized protein YdhG (YjbR/CyaY superfamily)
LYNNSGAVEEENEITMPRPKFDTIDDYIAAFPKDVQDDLQRLRRVIRESAPAAEEAISYGIPTFKLNGNLVHFAAYQHHIGFYPTSSGIAAFKKELMPYKLSKGTVQFPLGRPLPLDLIRRIVRYRIKESSAREKRS